MRAVTSWIELTRTGTNGSQLWDVAFISQALVATSLGSLPSNHASSRALLEWLEDCQMQENPKYWKQGYRNATKGAWPFSTKEQGYTVSDCAAEGMKAVLALQSLPFVPPLVEIVLTTGTATCLSSSRTLGCATAWTLSSGCRTRTVVLLPVRLSRCCILADSE